MACSAPGCRSRSDVNCGLPTGISFHRFPKQENIFKQWIHEINRPNWYPTRNSRVCSRHFALRCYKMGRLLRTAVPTIFPDPVPSKRSSGKRKSVANNNEVCCSKSRELWTPSSGHHKTVHCSSTIGKDNGFGNSYIWAGSLESGVKIASNHKMPVMVIIHKSWCRACKNLKPKFASSSEIQELSKHFVMVNLEDDEEPKNSNYAPDGSYIPRILFLDPNGRIDGEIVNEDGSSQHKYFYSKPEQIAKSMKKVLEKYKMMRFDV